MLFDASLTSIYIKIDNNFHLLEGVNHLKFSSNNLFIEDFSVNNDNWKKYFNHPSKQSISLIIQGIFNNCKASLEIFKLVLNPNFLECKISFATGDIITGEFLINNFEKLNEVNQEVTYRLSLASNGVIGKL